MPSWQSTSRIGCPIDNPARRSRGAAPSTRPQWTRVPLDFRPRWRYVVNKAGAANAAPALKYKFYFTPHFCGYTEFGIVPRKSDFPNSFNAMLLFIQYHLLESNKSHTSPLLPHPTAYRRTGCTVPDQDQNRIYLQVPEYLCAPFSYQGLHFLLSQE